MQKIQDREIIFSSTILAKDNEHITIEFTHKDIPFKFGLEFVQSSEVDPKARRINWSYLDDTIQIVLHGWNSSLGTALNDPVRLGQTETGEDFGFHILSHRVGNVHRADFQVLLGGGIWPKVD